MFSTLNMWKNETLQAKKDQEQHTCFESSYEQRKYLFKKILFFVNMSNEDVKQILHEINKDIYAKGEDIKITSRKKRIKLAFISYFSCFHLQTISSQ